MTHDTTESPRADGSGGTEPPGAAQSLRADETDFSSTDETDSSPTDETDPPSRTTRRGLLRIGGTGLALGGAVGSAGCLSALPPLGGGQRYGRIDAPASDDPEYARWVPAPWDEVSEDDYFGFGAARPGTAPRVPHLLAWRRASTVCSLDYFGVGWASYDRYVWTPAGSVLTGSFEAKTVRDTLGGTAYRPAGDYREYDLFERPDGRRVAVRDGTLLFVTPDDEHPDLERLADTGAGAHPRLVDANDAAATVVERASESTRVSAAREFGAFHEAAAWGADGFRVGDDGVYQVITLVFPSPDTITLDELQTAYRERTGLVEAWTQEADSFDAQMDERVATLETRVPEGDLRRFDAVAEPVQATWGFEWDAAERALTIRHEAGASADPNRLTVDIDTDEAPYRHDDRPVWTDVDRVEPGAETTLDLGAVTGLESVGLDLRRVGEDGWSYWNLAGWRAPTVDGGEGGDHS
ncbi:hypothetical protein RYH80_16645 [Halobaculum sp. MBLA0147]|uniref:hypothetical protein n=1 Tax=Halobaculum sp. MBLA0147 TaxID=3079934 RepID=UPI0035257001